MDINYGDPLSDLATCEEKDRVRIFERCVVVIGTKNTVHSYIEHGLHIDSEGNPKRIIDMTRDFRGLISFQSFRNTLRFNYPGIFADIKAKGGHLHE